MIASYVFLYKTIHHIGRWLSSLEMPQAYTPTNAFNSLTLQEPSSGTRNSPVRYFHTKHWETDMLKGGLLWLIGIPLPIILILFFMGWLS
ncbi:hypothetical protein FHR70_001573 [Microvirga lupini]|uniref:Uncharacterized protein n=1 Tax=Microvirga lupini TaxID=420324 RepID=A0A7W4VJV1_9HYPH|nr:hypothetical protein [Microvirga lupini]MBB3018519.1 hypothetical protein [Microvirga lupini]